MRTLLPRRIAILGATGSIGRSTIEVVRAAPDAYAIEGLSACSRWEDLAALIAECKPAVAVIAQQEHEAALRACVNGGTEVLSGAPALCEMVSRPGVDFVVSAIVGSAGLRATHTAIRAGRTIGLANKEALVAAGSVMMPEARSRGVTILPIDSEHSAIFQAMHAGRREEVECVYLTASGGPFRTWSRQQIESATLEDALSHPTWEMGPKITIDSATMMNKALEIIEAAWLFDLDPDEIKVLVHPESIVHSLVEFCDGSLIAQLGSPDMRTPIQYALSHPNRHAGPARRLDVASLRCLNFEPPDFERFPALRLGYDVARRRGTAGAALSAANEEAVEAFRNGRLRFCQIVPMVEDVLKRHPFIAEPTLDEIIRTEEWARREVCECLNSSATR